MFLDYGFRSACCIAPIKLGKKKIKGSSIKVKIWVCTRCQKREVDIVDVSKKQVQKSTDTELDTDDEPEL